jgi:hypothetical protein
VKLKDRASFKNWIKKKSSNDDALLLNNCKFGDFADHIYTIELEIKDTIDTARSASCPDIHRHPSCYSC